MWTQAQKDEEVFHEAGSSGAGPRRNGPPPACIGGRACREGVWEMEFSGKQSPGPVGRAAAHARAPPRPAAGHRMRTQRGPSQRKCGGPLR